jgi:proton glutamate symport protein
MLTIWKQRLISFVTSPYLIILGLLLGLYIGAFHKDIGKVLEPFGQIYLAALQMTIIPLIFVSVATSIANLLSSNHAKEFLKQIVRVFIPLLLLASFIGLIFAMIMKPGTNIGYTEDLNRIINSNGIHTREITLRDPIEIDNAKGFLNFLSDAVPSNIFTAVSEGKILQVVIFTIVFGIALGYIKQEMRREVVNIFSVLMSIFQIIISTVVKALPAGVCFLVAGQLSNMSADIFLVMLKFVSMSCITLLFFFFLCTIVMWKKSGVGYFQSISMMRYPIFVALSTNSSIAAMPAAITSLIDNFKFDRAATNLIMPLGIVTCRYGNIIYFSFATIFIAQLYHLPLDIYAYLIVLLGAIIGGVTTSGATGVVTLSMMNIVLEPLGLPFGAVLILFIAIDPIIDPLRTLLIVYVNSAATALIARKESEVEMKEAMA